jgi:hypothetical protein
MYLAPWRAWRLTWPVTAVFLLLALAAPNTAQAQAKHSADSILRQIAGEFLGISGYWFTSGSATRALGTPKFGGGGTTFYVRPAHRGSLLITGGIELVGASDHWLPFSGGNSFSLTGASFRVSGERGRVGRLVPYVSAGLFAGNVHSERLGFDTTSVVPSMAVGAQFKVHRYLTLSARYRISGEIGHINTDGFNIGLDIF